VTFRQLQLLVTSITLILFAVFAGWMGSKANDARFGGMIFMVLLLAFALQGVHEIPASPPRKAVPKFWGRFINAENGGVSIGPGRIFFPWTGFIFTYVVYDASEINFQMDDVEERTPDQGTVAIDPFFTYHVDQSNPVAFIQAGDRIGIETKFAERIAGRLREWISSRNEGPLNWMEARQSNGLAMDVIIQKLFPNEIDQYQVPPDVLAAIPGGNDIPMSVFMKYFLGSPALSEKIPQEEGVGKKLDDIRKNDRPTWDLLHAAIQRRISFTETVKSGECRFRIRNLGIEVTLANLGSIDAVGATAAAADEVAKATQFAAAQGIEGTNYREEVEQMKESLDDDAKAAIEAVNLRRKIQTKTTAETQFALRTDNLAALKEILAPISSAIGEVMLAKAKGSNPQPPPAPQAPPTPPTPTRP
jgi:hypothetical protein